jgi:hypothetical protein
VGEDESLPEGPDGDDQLVNSWQFLSKSMGNARFDAGSRSEGIYA